MCFPSLRDLDKIPTAELEKSGWLEVLDRMKSAPVGALAITSDHHPEGVLLTPDEYARLIRLAQHRIQTGEEVLEEVRREFDHHLAPLSEPGAAIRLSKAVTEPLSIDGFLLGQSNEGKDPPVD